MVRFPLTALMAVLVTLPSAVAAEDGAMPIDRLLTDIQSTLIRVRDAADVESLPPLSKVTLILNASLTTTGGGKVELVIVEAGGSISNGITQEITLELAPPQDKDKSPVGASTDSLADAIVEAARAVHKAAERTPPLHLKRLEASIAFTVKKDANAGSGFKLLPVTAQLEGKIENHDRQTAIIEFASEKK